MQPQVHAFVVTAAEIFELKGPVYEFSYCPDSAVPEAGWPSQWSADPRGPVGGEQAADLDRLEDLGQLPFPDGAAQTVLCIAALEHVFEPRQAVEEMIRILAPGGMLLLASAVDPSGVQHPDQYWRLTPGAVERLLGSLEATLVGWQGPEQSPHTVFGLGFKGPVPDGFLVSANRFLDRFQARLVETAGGVGWWPRLRRQAAACVRSRQERLRIRDHHKAQFVVQMPVDPRFKHRLLDSCLPKQSSGSRLDLRQ